MATSPPRQSDGIRQTLSMALSAACSSSIEEKAEGAHTSMATCGHRVHEAFNGDFGLPEVQHRWRRSRDLPRRR
jgi:hypothetical protein